MLNKRPWYETIFLNVLTQMVLVALLTVFMPACLLWGGVEQIYALDTRQNAIYATMFSNIAILLSLRFFSTVPGYKPIGYILLTVGGWYAILLLVFFLTRLPYSVYLIGMSALLILTFSYVLHWVSSYRGLPRVGLIPFGEAAQLSQLQALDWVSLNSPDAISVNHFSMIVADLHSPDLTAPWQKFLANAVLAGVPVYNAKQVEESLTGRVRIEYMYENNLGALIPSPAYAFFKRCLDMVLVLGVMPIALPMMLLTALAVFLERKGPVLFIQERVGLGAKPFKIYKFRSMVSHAELAGARMASHEDHRITRVGKFIRKTRLDELPQFFNVLKGDMSLIGPRPEQKALVDELAEKIPFYTYRHIVRPGISGWAQVMQGYASDCQDTKIKVEYDFYYIKYFSFGLDVLIIFKTLKTMLTGFGAR